MRTIRIFRPKRMEAAMNKLIVEMDGKPVGKLANGKELVISAGEEAHELSLHGGKLAAKHFSTKIGIPADGFDYNFQLDMLSITNGYSPMLRPSGGEPLAASTRLILLLGGTLTAVLLSPKLHEILRGLPDARLQLMIELEQWRLDLCCGEQRKALYSSPYSTHKGRLLAAALNSVERADLKTPEGRAKLTQKIFDDYLNHLPCFRQTAPNELAAAASRR